MRQQFQVAEEFEDMRIDRYLAEICPDLSRSYVQKLLKSGDVEADGVKVKPSYRVSAGEVVELEVQAPSEPEILAQDMDLDIVYEDEDVILINKPKGMVVHPAAGHYEGTLVNGLMAHCKDQLSGINGMLRPGIVHRIDKDTTGILIVCKNDMAHRSIAAQLKEHSITRRYQAIVCGVIREEEGTVDAPIGRHPTDRKKMCVNEKNGRHAVTHYRVLRRFADAMELVEAAGPGSRVLVVGGGILGVEAAPAPRPPRSVPGRRHSRRWRAAAGHRGSPARRSV